MTKFVTDTLRHLIKHHKKQLSEAENEINKVLSGREVILKDGRKGVIITYELLSGNECLKIYFSTTGKPYRNLLDEWDCRWFDFKDCEIL